MQDDLLFMQRALTLAARGLGYTQRNPLVGCVLAKDGKILGEGWHKRYGGPHAEVEAVQQAEAAGHSLEGATAYVTLEPCSHFGKTPPCADLLIEKKIARVVVATEDPFPQVAGRGLKKMRATGIQVEVGPLGEEARQQNRRFLVNVHQQRPYVLLKWAQTQDGFVAREDYSSKWISCAFSRTLAHKWRTEEQAILVGRRTAEIDNPKLTARHWHGPNPTRVFIDRQNRLPANLHLKDGSVPTLCLNTQKQGESENLKYIQLPENKNFAAEILQQLYAEGIASVMVEGGAMLLRAFLEADLWDEARVFVASVKFGKGVAAPAWPAAHFAEKRQSGADELLVWRRGEK